MSHGRSKHDDVLTPREWQVLDLIREGLTNEEIAARLGISHNTAKFHVSEILSKLGVASRDEAVQIMHDRKPQRRFPAWIPDLFSRAPTALLVAAGAGTVGLIVTLLLLATSSWLSQPSVQIDKPGREQMAGLDLPPTTVTAQSAAFVDPFAYCGAVGSVDEPDARYGGPATTAALVEGFARAIGVASDRVPSFVWRCAEGRVMAYTFGNNLHCGKADTNREPTAQMIEYCANPPQNLPEGLPPDLLRFIPRNLINNRNATVYSWECRDGRPEAVPGLAVDAQGFIERVWHVVQGTP